MNKAIWVVQFGEEVLYACATRKAADEYVNEMESKRDWEFLGEVTYSNGEVVDFDEVNNVDRVDYIFGSIASFPTTSLVVSIIQVPFADK